ncbi:hypothetical protein H0W26_03255 [Candidatus Dependentiae bacterium]|nr:hypothetical protein [Candidatus Dependentiae bacterium]
MSTMRNMQKDTYLYAGIGIFLVGSIIGMGYAGYSWYRNAKEAAAYKDLSESLDGYAKAAASSSLAQRSSANQWAEVQQAFEIGAQSHSSSVLYPYFLAYQADALLQQEKDAEALSLMDKAVASMDKTHPLYYAYALKDGLMNSDSSDPSRVQKGRELVQTLANDNANPLQDMARYYSALGARSRGEIDVAQQRLQQLIATGNEGSVWYQKALNSMR